MERDAQDRRLSSIRPVPPFTLAFGADILPTRRLSRLSRPMSTPFSNVVRGADLAIGNFEMPLTDGGAPLQKLLNIRANPAIAADVPELGFAVLTLANNHAVDYGWPALFETGRLLRDQGLTIVGVGADRDEAAALAICEVAGRRIGVVAFSCLTPTGMSAAPGRPGHLCASRRDGLRDRSLVSDGGARRPLRRYDPHARPRGRSPVG